MTQPTRVLLVRHGETAWNACGIYQGGRDVPLSEHGRAQAEALRDTLAGTPIDAAYTSPLARARETARLILGGRGVRAAVVPELRELSYGRCEALHPDARRAAFPSLDARWSDDPWGVAFPDGESLAAVAARVLPVWARLVAAHRGETVLVAAHGHVNRVILLHERRLPPSAFWSIAQENGAVVALDCAPRPYEAAA